MISSSTEFLAQSIFLGSTATLGVSPVSQNQTDLCFVMCVQMFGKSKCPICRHPSARMGNRNRCTSLLPTCSKSAIGHMELQCVFNDFQVERKILIYFCEPIWLQMCSCTSPPTQGHQGGTVFCIEGDRGHLQASSLPELSVVHRTF